VYFGPNRVDFGAVGRCCVSCVALESWFHSRSVSEGAGGDGGWVGGAAVEEEEGMGVICVGGVGEEPEGGGFDGTRGLGGSERNVSVTEGDGERVQFAMMSGANRRWTPGRFRRR
jgi:hypothetical protein